MGLQSEQFTRKAQKIQMLPIFSRHKFVYLILVRDYVHKLWKECKCIELRI